MVDDLVKKLLEAGVHFGHQTKRWNPKMKQFIFGARAGIYIVDLEKTAVLLTEACEVVKEVAAKGGKILFVGTKKQAQDIIEESAVKTGMFYVRNRWSGGLLTNFQTVKKSISRLQDIEKMKDNGVWENLKKKEIARLEKEKTKLLFNFGGIREMRSAPDLVFIVDPKRETIAVKEAVKLGIPIVGIVDTNCDPDHINYPVPGNDDALKSISFITTILADSVMEGRKEFFVAEKKATEEAKAAKEKQEKEIADKKVAAKKATEAAAAAAAKSAETKPVTTDASAKQK